MNIKLDKISFSYEEKKIFDNFSLDIKSGETIAVIGHNGSGKSTLAKIILGLLDPTSGSIYVDDQLIDEHNNEELRKKMGIIFQNPDNQFVGVTVKDDIAFGLENRCMPKDEMEKRILEYLKLVDMEEYILANPEELSGGQKQRIAIAGVLAMDPDLIVFDEATSMLDPAYTRDIINLIKHICETSNKTILIITHNLEEALLADKVVVLKKGNIISSGTPREVFRDSNKLSESGLKNVPTLELLDVLKNQNYPNKSKIEAYLWESTFKK